MQITSIGYTQNEFSSTPFAHMLCRLNVSCGRMDTSSKNFVKSWAHTENEFGFFFSLF